MYTIVKFLTNPLYVAIVIFLFVLVMSAFGLLGGQGTEPSEYVSIIPIGFAIFYPPFLFMSLFARNRLKQPKKAGRLLGMWIIAAASALAWTASIVFSDNEQAGLGFMFLGPIAMAGGVAGYLGCWVFGSLLRK